LAVKYYCKAKQILGEGRTTAGLELKKLKYYREKCAAAIGVGAQEVRRGGGGIGKILGALLFIGVVGGVVWYLFFSKNAPLKKKGKYTKVYAKLSVTYKGLNSKGHRKLTVDNAVKNDEDFNYPQAAGANSTCSDATKSESYSYDVTISGNAMVIKQDYTNWDYVSFVIPGTNYKMLCADYTLDVTKYEYESGGKDPGEPVPTGLDALQLSTDKNCTQISQRVHDCNVTATITFNQPSAGAKAQRTYSVSTSNVKKTT
jgi:hypothetical protein